MDVSKLTELRDKAKAKKTNVEISAKDLCQLVKQSKTENEGLTKAAEALKDEPATKCTLQFADFDDLIDAVSKTPAAKFELPPKP
jgi:negative regulator of genetic competence, sporulation and motility